MAKTSINVRACNIGSAERHNLRSKELDYIRPELSHRNEQWIEMNIAEVLEDIREKYKQHTGQSMQKKATPIREGVVVIEDGTTLRQLQNFAERIEERFGIHTFQIYTHKDEGANVWNGNAETWKPNYHAHMIFDWTDGETGRTRKLNKQDMAEMQTMLAECLGMERGISSDRKHLSAIQYKNMAEAEKTAQIEKECRQMENKRNTIANEVKQAGEKLEEVQGKLKEATTEIKVQKLKGAAADTGTALLKAGTTVIDATASLFNSGKVKRQEQEIAELKRENYELEMKNQNLSGNIRTANKEIERERENTRRALRAGSEKLKPITDLFPCMDNAKENIEELRTMGVGDNDIRLLLTGKEITYSGNLYDRERRKSHQVKSVKIDIAKNRAGNTTIWLNDVHFKEFFKQLWQKLQKALGLDNGRGFHL
jgi:predicted  nucleic acid-binding Zn-ribbon protein